MDGHPIRILIGRITMGKRSGLSFADIQKKQMMQNYEDARSRQAEDAALKTAALADAQSEAVLLETPSEELAQSVPQAAPTTETILQPGPSPENLFPADLTAQTEIVPSQEGIARVQREGVPVLQDEMYGGVTGLAPAEQVTSLYTEQLQDESVDRAIMDEGMAPLFAQYAMEDSKSEDDGVRMLASALDAGSKSFMKTSGNQNIFGKEIDTASIPNNNADTDPMGFLKKNSDTFAYAIKGFDKLNMSIDPADPNSDIRPEFGEVAALAVILEVGNRLKLQADEVDKEASKRRYDGALDRINIGKAIGQRIERLAYPTLPSDRDPQAMFTGETEEFGYKSRLTGEEQSMLGQVTIQGFADSPMFDWFESYVINTPGQPPKVSYRLTREGDKKLSDIRRGAKKALGMKGHDRPVSKVPLEKGKLPGEGAYTQKEITTMVGPNQLTPPIVEAIDALGKVAHTVKPHSALLMGGMLTTAAMNRDSLFAKYAKQDTRYAKIKEEEILSDYLGQAEADGLTPQQLGNFDTFEQAAASAMARIVDDHLAMRQETLKDGIIRANEPFYYGYTAINNSSRMMITQTELNYQADKVARFLVGGASPALMRKGSNSKTEKGFMRVIARSVVPGADKMSVKDQLANLNNNMDYYVKLGKQLTTYTTVNAAVMNTAKQIVGEQDVLPETPPLLINTDLETLLDQHGKDGFYFAIDALHELARYDATPPNGKFATRVKAEADGNANGAVIQAEQMGVEEILKKGGVLYDSLDSTGDIRDAVFGHMIMYDPVAKEPRMADAFKQIEAKGKVKELLKQPIMTSIYGKDAAFHSDTAKKFINDNPEIFSSFNDRDELEKDLTTFIEYGLENGLGGALEHAVIAKRLGRAFNIANKIAEVKGANGFMVQAGGFEYIDDNPDPTIFEFGPGTNRSIAKITTKRRVASAAQPAKGVKIEPGKISDPGLGSKLRNQLAVNGTQNIDATIMQETIVDAANKMPDRVIMQVYDAVMGDSDTYAPLVDIINTRFKSVNNKYSMVKAERDALQKLKADVAKDVARKAAAGETFDIGLEGEYKSMGDLLNRIGAIINRDMKGSGDKLEANYNPVKDMSFKQAKILKSLAIKSGWSFGQKTNPIKPEQYQALFNEALNTLAIEKDLDRFIAKVQANKAAIRKKVAEGKYADVKDQYS